MLLLQRLRVCVERLSGSAARIPGGWIGPDGDVEWFPGPEYSHEDSIRDGGPFGIRREETEESRDPDRRYAEALRQGYTAFRRSGEWHGDPDWTLQVSGYGDLARRRIQEWAKRCLDRYPEEEGAELEILETAHGKSIARIRLGEAARGLLNAHD